MAFLLALFLFLFINRPILASDNIFGLHLTQPSDIHSAAKIINSSGGDWGWATIVIRLDQLDKNTWQDFFDTCRRLHITPIVRLSTIMENGYWKAPQTSEIDQLVSFLNSLNWPQKTQHIILFNEINHGTEWGGEVNIPNYVDISIYASDKLKAANPNFFVLGGGFDLAAPDNPPVYKSAPAVYREIANYKKEYFDKIDGLASHSYPNHGFVGTPKESGRHSIRGYDWELNYIKSLGVTKEYPIFITETGWPHREGESKNNRYYTIDTAARFLLESFNSWSQDQRVKAVTPFIYNYPNEPFDHFSWVDKTERLYPSYENLVNLPKPANKIEQVNSYQLIKIDVPLVVFPQKEYIGQVTLKNNGQTIWGEYKFCLTPKASSNITLDSICTLDSHVQPGSEEKFYFKFKLDDQIKTDKTTISWESLPVTEITPFTPKGILYNPKSSLKDAAISFFYSLLI